MRRAIGLKFMLAVPLVMAMSTLVRSDLSLEAFHAYLANELAAHEESQELAKLDMAVAGYSAGLKAKNDVLKAWHGQLVAECQRIQQLIANPPHPFTQTEIQVLQQKYEYIAGIAAGLDDVISHDESLIDLTEDFSLTGDANHLVDLANKMLAALGRPDRYPPFGSPAPRPISGGGPVDSAPTDTNPDDLLKSNVSFLEKLQTAIKGKGVVLDLVHGNVMQKIAASLDSYLAKMDAEIDALEGTTDPDLIAKRDCLLSFRVAISAANLFVHTLADKESDESFALASLSGQTVQSAIDGIKYLRGLLRR